MNQQKRIKEIFDRISPRYDLANHLLSFGTDFRWRKKLVKLSTPLANQKILDICCGTGDQAFAFKKYNPSLEVTGLDISESMIAIAKSKYSNINFLVSDCTNIDLPSNSFDIISCSFGIRNIPKFDLTLKEAYRLLKPNGKLAIMEFSMPKSIFFRPLYYSYLHYLLPLLGGIITNHYKDYRYLAESVDKWDRTIKLSENIDKAEFAKVDIINITLSIAKAYIAYKDTNNND